MAAYSTTVFFGPPTSGLFVQNDTYTDTGGAQYQCVRGGQPGDWASVGVTSGATVGVGAKAGATVTAVESGDNVVHKTVLTLAATPQAVVNGTEYQGTKIYDFPEGRILILGVAASLAPTTTSAIASTLNSGVTGALSLGSATASNVSLTGTMVDMLPTTAFTTSTVIDVAAAAAVAALAVSAQFDGTTTAKDMYLNSAFATTTDVDADATITWSGTITFTWINLGDY